MGELCALVMNTLGAMEHNQVAVTNENKEAPPSAIPIHAVVARNLPFLQGLHILNPCPD
jgi:hypothetical protein